MPPEDFARIANNFYTSKGIVASPEHISLNAEFVNYFAANQETIKTKYKVAFVFICLNPLYWQYAAEMVQGARQFFLPGHKTEYFFWTDIPKETDDIVARYKQALIEHGHDVSGVDITKGGLILQGKNNMPLNTPSIIKGIVDLRGQADIHLIPTEATPFPYPTLLRYNLFLSEEEKLKEFDYIFFCDVDMRFVSIVGDEILSPLTAAVHPGYHIRKELYPPIESNPKSASYIKQSGKIINDPGARNAQGEVFNTRFLPMYYAGGFQGGKADRYIEAMKETRKIIETDLNRGYIPRWNDESAWNRYLHDNEPEVVLSPSYIYPDSLIKEYYEPIVWGQSYPPKLITVTKWFSLSAEGGQFLNKILGK